MLRKAAFMLAIGLWLSPRPADALDTDDLLALAAMPLAVAAASELTGISPVQLVDAVTLLNQADVPPTQFIETIRYVPVALVPAPVVTSAPGPDFIMFLRDRTREGLRGEAFVTSIEQRFRAYDIGPVNLRVRVPRPVDANFFPVVVRDRVAASARAHPHGGPPGQLKKELGVQTGAEVVHGAKPGKGPDDRLGVAPPGEKERGRGKPNANRGGGKGKGKGHGDSHGGGSGKGKS